MNILQSKMNIGATSVVTFTRIGSSFMAISKFNILQQIRQRLNRTAIQNPSLARRLCQLIPAHCPFERNVQVFRRTFHIPSLCKLNPLYAEVLKNSLRQKKRGQKIVFCPLSNKK